MALLPDDTLRTARKLFPHVAGGRVYMNHAATSPLSTRVVEAMQRHLIERSEGKLDSYWIDIPMVKELREMVRRLINAESADRISVQANTSEAINVIASGLPWREGDRVLLTRAEFPANVYPYLNLRSRGVKIDWLPDADGVVTPEMIEQALTPHTRLLALSAVQFLSGFRADLGTIGALCRSRDVVFAVDGIQAVGGVTIDVQNLHIDALAAGAQKWQMGPHGTGFLYLTQSLQERIRQAHLGWLSVANPWDFKDYEQAIAPSARRYEGGTLAMPGLWGMHAAIGTLLEFHPEDIESHILSLTELLLEKFLTISGVVPVTPRERERRAGIVTVRVNSPHVPEKVFAALEQRAVLVALREGCLRFSPHFYNTPADVETAAEALREALSNRIVAV